MAHNNSLPAGDRIEPVPLIGNLPNQRQVHVIGLGDGNYFRAWRRRGGYVSVKNLHRAQLFSPRASKNLRRTIAKLQSKKVAAVVVDVNVIIGQAE